MAKLEKTITINAPVEMVFGYLDERELELMLANLKARMEA